MTYRAQDSLFWPGMSNDITKARIECRSCNEYAPTQPAMPAATPFIAQSPFQAVASDYCEFGGSHYLVTVDRFTNWPTVSSAKPGTLASGTKGLLSALRSLFATFGIPEEISSDGGPEYTSPMFSDFMEKWGVRHRCSSVSNAQSNGRAEVCVKSVKRLLRTNVSADGSLDSDAVMRGLLQLRNTPDPDTNLSPAQILLGRKLRDFLPIPPLTTIFDNASPVREEWKSMWQGKEEVLKRRMGAMVDQMNAKAHELKPLAVGDHVHIQNQSGNHPTRWNKTGEIMQVGEHDKYMIRVHGSRRITVRNRRFLRKFLPLGEKMTEQLFKLPPSEENCNPSNQLDDVPPSAPTPATPTTLADIPQSPKMGMPASSDNPVGEKSSDFEDSQVEADRKEPALVESPMLRRSTRERRKPDYYGKLVEKDKTE